MSHQRKDVVELTFFVTDTESVLMRRAGRSCQSFRRRMIRLREDTAERVRDCMSLNSWQSRCTDILEVESEPGRGSTFSCAISQSTVQAVEQEKEQNIV